MAHDDVAMVESATRPGKLESVNIEIAENGFLVSCHYKPKKSKKNASAGEPVGWEPPRKKVFETVDSLKTFLDDALPKGKGKGGGYEDEE